MREGDKTLSRQERVNMAKLRYGTSWIQPDEPCLGLYEINLQSPKGWRRFQIIHVMRGDKPAEYRRDMGAAKSFKADQLRVLGGAKDEVTGRFYVEHTVGELVDIADWRRNGEQFDRLELAGVDKIKV